ncbi:hypothetical protein DM02DRAFT_653843 [Periconia macrospinosa]|uniref:Uncharacterized protein n=1 Tax=Periconia macrospinosa TaxID=97972 RepID=A0A2V1DVG6_9PLEO|nr:hypothetical protein DM02DRAFT_653843 [Periconia macrospinosa]
MTAGEPMHMHTARNGGPRRAARNLVYRICDKIIYGSQELQKIADGMTVLSKVLQDVADVLEAAKAKCVYRPRVLEDTGAVLKRFESVQADVRKITESQGRSPEIRFRGGLR